MSNFTTSKIDQIKEEYSKKHPSGANYDVVVEKKEYQTSTFYTVKVYAIDEKGLRADLKPLGTNGDYEIKIKNGRWHWGLPAGNYSSQKGSKMAYPNLLTKALVYHFSWSEKAAKWVPIFSKLRRLATIQVKFWDMGALETFYILPNREGIWGYEGGELKMLFQNIQQVKEEVKSKNCRGWVKCE